MTAQPEQVKPDSPGKATYGMPLTAEMMEQTNLTASQLAEGLRRFPNIHPRDNTAALAALAVAMFTIAVGYGVILPILPSLLPRFMPGASAAANASHTGLLTGVYMLALVLFAPLCGALSDRLGRRPILLIGLVGYTVSLVAFSWAQSMAAAYLVRFLAGAFAAAVIPAAAAFVSETTDIRRRAGQLAWLSSASLIGYLVGPALSGWIYAVGKRVSHAESLGMNPEGLIAWPLYVAGALAIVALAIVLKLVPQMSRPVSASAAALTSPSTPTEAVKMYAALGLLVTFGVGAFEVGLAVFAKQSLALDPTALAVMYAECSVVMLVAQGLVAFIPRSDRVSAAAVIAGGFAAMTIGFALLPSARGSFALVAVVGLVSAGAGVVLPLLGYLASLRTAAQLGVTLGIQTAASGLGQGIGSAVGGWLFGALAETSFWIFAGLMAAGTAAAAIGRARFGLTRVST